VWAKNVSGWCSFGGLTCIGTYRAGMSPDWGILGLLRSVANLKRILFVARNGENGWAMQQVQVILKWV